MKTDIEVINDRIVSVIKLQLPGLILAMNADKREYSESTGRPLVQLEEIEDAAYLEDRWHEGQLHNVPPYPVSYVLDWLNPQVVGSNAGISWRVPFAFHILVNETFATNMSILMVRYAKIQVDLITKYVNRIPDITGGVTVIDADAVPMEDNENGTPFTSCSILFNIDLPI
jgi:hypothetical protein